MAAIRGKFRILYIKTAGQDWRRVAHLRVNSWQSTVDFLPTTTRANKGHKTQRPVSIGDTISFSAIIFQDNDVVGKVGYKELKKIKNARTLFDWKLQADGEAFIDAGRGHLASLGETADVGDVMTYEGSIQVYGAPLDLSDVDPPTRPILSINNIDAFELSADLTWTESFDTNALSSYELRISESSGEDILIDVGNVNEYKLFWLRYFVYFSVNVRAIDIAGNKSAWSAKRLLYIPLPSGVPAVDYMQFEDGGTILDESGIPLEFE